MPRPAAATDGRGRPYGVARRSLAVATLLVASWPAASRATEPAPNAVARAADRAAWFLVGGVFQPSLVQALGGGRALVCNDQGCQVYDRATGGWTPTGSVVLPLNTLASLCRRDGAVVAVDGARTVASAIWSPATGRWTTAAALPESLNHLETAELEDGRIIAVGQSRSRQRAYVADARVTAWSLLVDSPEGLAAPWSVPTRSGILLFSGEHAWRYTVAKDGWHEVGFGDLSLGRFSTLQAWQDEVLVARAETGETTMVARDGSSRRTQTLPSASGTGLRRIAGSGAAQAFLVLHGNDTWLWRRPEEPLVPLPPNPIEGSYLTIALDDAHLLGIGSSGAVTELALDGRGPPGRPCDGLARYLGQPQRPTPSVIEMGFVGDGCREQVRRGEAPEVLARVRAWTDEAAPPAATFGATVQSVNADSARAFACALQDPAALQELPRWLTRSQGRFHAICYRSLVTWPGADAVWERALRTVVSKNAAGWYVDRAVIDLVAAVPTREMRERLVSTLRTAAERHAGGFDDLRDAVCKPDPDASGARQQTCAQVASLHQKDWWRQAAEEAAQPTPPAYPILIATAVLAGATGVAYATRNEGASRAIATTSGALGGLTLGFTAAGVGLLTSHGWGVPGGGHDAGGWVAAASLLGGVLGGIGAYAASGSPASRAPVTAAGLAIPFLFTVVASFH